MNPVGENEIRGSFVNCSKGEARRLNLPRGLVGLPRADLACSLYVRGIRKTELAVQFETLTLEERIARAVSNLSLFLDRVFEDTESLSTSR